RLPFADQQPLAFFLQLLSPRDISEEDGKPLCSWKRADIHPDRERRVVLLELHRLLLGHRSLVLPLIRRAYGRRELIPDVASAELLTAAEEETFRFGVYVRDDPGSVHSEKRVGDAFQDPG